jgi:hypothetical protein
LHSDAHSSVHEINSSIKSDIDMSINRMLSHPSETLPGSALIGTRQSQELSNENYSQENVAFHSTSHIHHELMSGHRNARRNPHPASHETNIEDNADLSASVDSDDEFDYNAEVDLNDFDYDDSSFNWRPPSSAQLPSTGPPLPDLKHIRV